MAHRSEKTGQSDGPAMPMSFENDDHHPLTREELRIRNAYLEHLLDSAPDAIVWAAPDHRVFRVNPGFSQLFGYSPEEVLGRKVGDLISPGDLSAEASEITRRVESGERVRTETVRVRKDGVPIIVDLVVSPIVFQGRQVGVCASYRDITERKRAEDALKGSEERFRQMAENVKEVFWLFDWKEQRVVYVNPAYESIWGRVPENLYKKYDEWAESIYPDDLTYARESFEQITRGEEGPREYRIVRPDGAVRWISDRGFRVLDEKGEVRRIAGIAEDITERKETETALKDAHRTLLTVLDSIDATIYAADMKTYEILFMNRFMRDSFGRDMVGEICWKVFRGYDAPCDHCTNARLLDENGESTGVCVWEGQNPITGRWYINYDRAIKWMDGRMVRLQVATDITSMKNAESALRREKEYLDALHQTTLGLISRLETEELLENIVERASQLAGTPDAFIYVLDPEETELVLRIALGFYNKMIGFRLKPGEGLAGKVLQSGEPILVEDYSSWPGRSYDQAFLGVKSVIALPLKSGAKIVGVIGLGSFKADRKFGDAEMGILSRFAELASITLDNALLHMRVKEELVQRKKAEEDRARLERQLLHAQKMEAIGTLAAGIAHDFNNLLMGIQGNASLALMEMNENHPHRQTLKNIEDSVRRGAELTGQLLGFARGGKYEVRPTDLNDVINKSLSLFIRTKKEITLHAKSQDELWSVLVDRGQIEQVLLNLYINAWQSMPGGGTLSVSTENFVMGEDLARSFNLTAGRYVKFTIADTGIGMDKATQDRIFEPFFTTKKMGKGAGLGLASAYGIIKNHGGSIEVESRKGEGTTFRIYLPASETKALPHDETAPEPVKGFATILLVDDEEMIVQVGARMLEKLGYRVLVAKNGKKVLDLLKNCPDPIDLVILDMIMPEMSGTETFEKLREVNPHVKVLLSSGYSVEGQADELLRKGCQGFIQKPYDIGELSEKLRSVIGEENSP